MLRIARGALPSRVWRRTLTTKTENPPYHGPLAGPARKLKILSLGAFGMVTSMTPIIMMVDSTMPLNARIVMCAALIGTSGISTAAVGWVGAPYVSTLRQRGDEVLEMETSTLFLQKRVTRVYDWRMFLKGTGRAFAKWELAEEVARRPGEETQNGEETVAETVDAGGRIVGRWIVRWGTDGRGQCRGEGQIVRYFNVHEELL
ncbi:hypothetical protein M422DRAFT_195225 [Sphaerobolus stellatus SS14]|uniref:Uncharacterized protein n=1 Tax=Sphaerobolus stellatus (strain SS14) TaxID=990650 RepID=A0A0C9UFQ1_SPHS4|nr:hypothetical protein M422DRAFT_195225 [Sphaerobolus stellatus SS14]